MAKVEFDLKYGIIATIPDPEDAKMLKIVHFVGFQSEPTKKEFEHIYAELKLDPEFGLTDVDFDLYDAPAHIVEMYRLKAEEENYGEPLTDEA
jgi:hypothetical protein